MESIKNAADAWYNEVEDPGFSNTDIDPFV